MKMHQRAEKKINTTVPDLGVGLGGCRGNGLFVGCGSGIKLMTSLA